MGFAKYTRNWFIITTGVKFALIVAPADMHAKSYSRVVANDGVIHFNADINEFVWIVPSLAISLAHLGIKKSCVLGSVYLDVGAA